MYSPVPYESAEQQALFAWAAMYAAKYPALNRMYHIPNEGKRSYATGRRMRAEGLKKGVPDICLPCARGGYHGLYIELKRRKGGSLSEDQKEWLGALRDEGYMAVMCKGWEEASEMILRYLNLDKRKEQ